MLLHNIILTATFAVTTLVGCWFWKQTIIGHPSGTINFPGEDRSAAARWGLLDVVGIGLFWLFAQSSVALIAVFATGISAEQLIDHPEVMTWVAWSAGFAQVTTMAFAWWYLCIQYNYAARDFGMADGQNWPGIVAGARGFAMWIPIVWLIQFLMVQIIDYQHPTIDSLVKQPQPLEMLQLWFGAVIVAPIVEEFLFRGVLQGWLQRLGRPVAGELPESILLGSRDRKEFDIPSLTESPGRPLHWPAILVTSLIFALMHASQGPAPVALFVLSLGIGYLYQRTGSLLACIVMHMLLNFFTLTLIALETAGY